MIKVGIVDDDKLARIGLTNLINWQSYDMEIVFDTSSGVDFIKYLENNIVNLAFIDLEMPGMFGLDLLKEIKIISPNTYCVIVTMHDDFKYIQEALRIGVFDYIIKTDFGGNEILEIIDRIKMRLDNDNKDENGTNQCIYRAIEIIRDERSQYYTASEMSKKVNMSRSYFSTCFKQIVGSNFNEYIREEKIKCAKELLKEDIPIGEIAHLIGYSNEKYFSTIFKGATGLSPSDFRKKLY